MRRMRRKIIWIVFFIIIIGFKSGYSEDLFSPIETKKFSLIPSFIEHHQLMLGMTRNQAIESAGKPDKINIHQGIWGINEQWIYREKHWTGKIWITYDNDIYLYFENGEMTSIQK